MPIKDIKTFIFINRSINFQQFTTEKKRTCSNTFVHSEANKTYDLIYHLSASSHAAYKHLGTAAEKYTRKKIKKKNNVTTFIVKQMSYHERLKYLDLTTLELRT